MRERAGADLVPLVAHAHCVSNAFSDPLQFDLFVKIVKGSNVLHSV